MANALIAFANPFSPAGLETHEEERLRGAHLDYHAGIITIIIIIIIIMVMGLVFILPVLSRHRNKLCSAWSKCCAENGLRDAKKKWSFFSTSKGQQPKLWLPQTGIFTSVLFQRFTKSWKERCQKLGKTVIQHVPKRKERIWLIGHSVNG